MLMKKHLIAALAGIMMLAVTAPTFAADVTGNLSFGYNYDLETMEPTAHGFVDNEWGLALTGNVSDDVTVGIGFDNARFLNDLALIPTEAWIQAKNTLFGTVKLGAFEMAFGENDYNYTSIDDGFLNVQVANEFAGIGVTGGVQFANNGKVHALGAAASATLLDSLQGTIGVLAEKKADESWGDPAIGYQVAYTGVPNLALGVRGNLAAEEIAASAAYQLLPAMKVYALAGQNVPNDENTGNPELDVDDQIIQAGVDVGIENGLHAGASYTVAERGDGRHEIVSLTGGYDYELAKGLVVGLDARHTIENDVGETAFGASVGLSF